MIDSFCDLHFSSAEDPGQSEPAKEQGRKTSVAVDSTSGSHNGSKRFSSGSESITITGGQSSRSRTSEGANWFIKS